MEPSRSAKNKRKQLRHFSTLSKPCAKIEKRQSPYIGQRKGQAKVPETKGNNYADIVETVRKT